MLSQPLRGRTVAVLVESEFIPYEIAAYRACFELLGAELQFVSRVVYGDNPPRSLTFVSDVDQ